MDLALIVLTLAFPGGASVRSPRPAWRAVTLVLLSLLCAVTGASAESGQKAFEKNWIGRVVVVKQPLYSLVYKERGVLGSTAAKRDGLTVVTPFAGIYFRFDGRRHVDDVSSPDVLKMANAVKNAYVRSQLLDEGAVQVIDPVMLARYDPGTELVVRAARITLESVRLELALATDSEKELVTSLTVHWPTPLSKSFAERADVERLIEHYLAARD